MNGCGYYTNNFEQNLDKHGGLSDKYGCLGQYSKIYTLGCPNIVHQRPIFYRVKWLRMQGHGLPAILEITGSNPSPGQN